MGFTGHGTIQEGTIVFSQPLPLPEGTEVLVHVETLGESASRTVRAEPGDLTRLPFFGMWADREDLADSTESVRRQRAKWAQRLERRD